jgi:YidC/Oxa1 family membrane protein insertase
MVLSVAIMVGYVALQAVFFPKPKVEVAEVEGEPVPDEKAPEAAPPKEPSPEPAPTELTPETPDGKTPETTESPESPETTESPDGLQSTTASQTWANLGSVDPASPYRMLVTFNSRGAAIERIELSNPRYRDLEDRSGYIGHLALSDVRGGSGCVVNIVGAGTPAAQAVNDKDARLVGLQPGDVILALDGAPIESRLALELFLSKTRPGQTVALQIDRGGQKLTFATTLMRRPLEVIRPEIEPTSPLEVALPQRHPNSLKLSLLGSRKLMTPTTEIALHDPLRDRHWEMLPSTPQSADSVAFRFQLNSQQAEELGLKGAVEVIKRYTLAKVEANEGDDPLAMAYHIDCELEIRNLTKKAMEVAWQLDGPNGLPLEGWWYSNKISPHWGGAGARDVLWRPSGKSRDFRSTSQIFNYAKKNPEKPIQSLLGNDETTQVDYFDVDAQYFTAALMPSAEEDPAASTFRYASSLPVNGIENIEKVDYKRTNVTFRITSDLKRIPAEGSYKQTMRLFAGPKVPDLLDRYGLFDIMEYGWFRAVSKPLSWLLHFLKHNVVFNYGLAIILLTVIVRGGMFPFSRKAAKNAQIMQQLSPELKKITEKYKNDMQKRSEAQSELFKRHKYHPLSGCLPMFLQLPIFLGLYRSLAVDIELRQAPLIPGIQWASNLAGPDMLFYWGNLLPKFLAGEASGWLGPYFNILPLISVVFLVIHQKLFTPPATDEQTKMTQDMMKYMTLFMGVLFFKVPAGLCLYFITSSLWSVCERLMLPSITPGGAAAGTPVLAKPIPSNPGGNGAEQSSKSAKKKQRRS